MNLRSRPVIPVDHLWVRVCRPSWDDPFDPGFAKASGGRWTPPGSWPTLYLSRDVATARLQVARLLEGSPVGPDDLTDDAFDLVAACLPPGQEAADVVTVDGIVAAGLPPTYPESAGGVRVPHGECWPVAEAAYAMGLDGVESRSAASTSGVGHELAWWPRGRRPRQETGRVAFGRWRAKDVTDAVHLFPTASAVA